MDAHIPDDELSLLAHDPEEFTHQRRTEIEQHAAGCAQCGKTLRFYTITEEDLRDPLVWQPVLPTTAAMITGYASRCEAEDAEADRLLEGYFAAPPRAAWVDLTARREFRTGGVVRRLSARAHAIVASEPLAALTYADQAQAIADLLPDDTYPNLAVYEVRGTAWKERANALLRLGEFDEALESLKRAERAYSRLSSSGHGLAAVELVRAAVYCERHDLQIAAIHAERAEGAFARLGLQHHCMTALHLRGTIRYNALDLDAAAAIFQQVIDFGEELGDAEWVAKGSYSKANCELDRGDLGTASVLFTKALVILRDVGPVADRISTEWGLARVVLNGGNASNALRRFQDVMAAFTELGMVNDAALVGLDMADALLLLERPEEVTKVAARSFRLLKKGGVMTAALTALAYLQEAAAKGRVSPQIIQDVRQFLRRAERNPAVIFIPPPDTSD